jgi:hypothetical protein
MGLLNRVTGGSTVRDEGAFLQAEAERMSSKNKLQTGLEYTARALHRLGTRPSLGLFPMAPTDTSRRFQSPLHGSRVIFWHGFPAMLLGAHLKDSTEELPRTSRMRHSLSQPGAKTFNEHSRHSHHSYDSLLELFYHTSSHA